MGTTNVKQTPIPVVPRTMKIVNPDGTPTRSGQLLLQQLQASNTIFGTHDTRPAPGDAPSGALYFETDRGVLYSNENGNWQYVAGTMYATLSPDQRPTDLGQYDGGFEFVANDTDPAIRGRSFIWDGTEWIETTQVLYGTHSGRPAVADAPARCLYMETDRGSVIYQNQGTAWEYIAGTMFGTISPDQRPTDLGPPDAGFDFRTNVDPAREFLWSGGDWVETTPIRYGTHAERLATPVAGLISGMFWTETDRGNVIYELQSGVWLFLTGTMWGTLSPDQRPTDLGVNDDGFTFLATVTPLRSFIWASPVWVETTNVAGSSALIHPNVVTKVGATTGGIVEGGITDLSAGNSGKVTITAAGNVGIGMASPACLLNLQQSVDTVLGGFGVSGVLGRTTYLHTDNNLVGHLHCGNTGGGVLALNYGGGSVGIGTASPTGNFSVLGNSAGGAVNIDLQNNAPSTHNNEVRLRFMNYGSLVAAPTVAPYISSIETDTPGAGGGDMAFGLWNGATLTEKMRITAGGNVGIGTTLPGFSLTLATDSAAKPGTSTWTISSSLKVKQNVKELQGGLPIINQLRPIEAEYNGVDGTPRGQRIVSLIAEEVQPVLPGAVTSHNSKIGPEGRQQETEFLDLNVHEILFHLILAVQQLSRGKP